MQLANVAIQFRSMQSLPPLLRPCRRDAVASASTAPTNACVIRRLLNVHVPAGAMQCCGERGAGQ